ncbi:MAG TPA: response regulator, partial [Burkholderiales bacterium]
MAHAVLIVEDELILAKNISKYLEREGFEVKSATSGEQALPLLDSFKPDAVLLDFNLPGMNGLQVLQKIRERDRETKVIMVTGHGNVQVAVDAMRAAPTITSPSRWYSPSSSCCWRMPWATNG